MLTQIQIWAENSDGKAFFWLKGMAGTGKSTISRTFAAACHSRTRLTDGLPLNDSIYLGASFFFDQSKPDRKNARKLFTTLARTLAEAVPDLKESLCNAIASHPNIANESLGSQWKHLIIQPLLALESRVFVPVHLVFVIDALDECEPASDVSLILQLMSQLNDLKIIKIRMLITSRPEAHISLGFRLTQANLLHESILNKVASNSEHGCKDGITLFLEHEFAGVRAIHMLSEDWPGDEKIKQLLRDADGLFIYAATATRFLKAPRLTRSQLERRLKLLFEKEGATSSPQRSLDEIYTRILQFSVISEDAIEDEIEELSVLFKQIVGSIIILFEPLSMAALSNLTFVPKHQVHETLQGLHSVLSVPEDGNSAVQLLHLSFRDFLLDRKRCLDSRLKIREPGQHGVVLMNCLKVLSDTLHRDIFHLNQPEIAASEIEISLVHQFLPTHAQYACLYWIDHLVSSDIEPSDNGDVHKFFRMHFLHWLEAIYLFGKIPEGVREIQKLSDYLSSLPVSCTL